MKMLSFVSRLREILTRRYYRAWLFSRCDGGRQVVVGPDVWRNFHFTHPENIRFGRGTVVNGDCYINAQGGVSFGHHCHVGKGLTIFSSNHNYLSTTAIPYDHQDILKPVRIGDCVWIGANVSILPGATIGAGAILSMGAVVRGEVPACAIVSGNPAKVVGQRDEQTFQRLTAAEAFA